MTNDPQPTPPRTPPSRLRRSERRSPSPLLAYLIALFAVAFALLLLSYFMQQRRSDRQLISGLQENVSAMQTVNAMLERSQTLEEENEQLRAQLDALQGRIADLEDRQAGAEASERTVLALDWLWRIEREYFRRHYEDAKAMVQAFEQTGLTADLPAEPLIDPAYRSPLQQYQAICDALSDR